MDNLSCYGNKVEPKPSKQEIILRLVEAVIAKLPVDELLKNPKLKENLVNLADEIYNA